jgi:hypothetical protein
MFVCVMIFLFYLKAFFKDFNKEFYHKSCKYIFQKSLHLLIKPKPYLHTNFYYLLNLGKSLFHSEFFIVLIHSDSFHMN